jgi:UDP-N-acetylglucosamine:LPS N-acetylglucosamine transferase
MDTEGKAATLKIGLVASAGGHLTQLLCTAKSWAGYETFFVTTNEAARRKLRQHGHVYIVNECNRTQPLRLLKAFFKCIRILGRERPDVVMSSGAAPGLLMCVLGKIRGAKVVWLDSIANVDRLSLSGRMVRPFADLILTQWPEIAERDKTIKHAGSVV